MRNRSRIHLFCALCVLAAPFSALCTAAQPSVKTVFRIGAFNRSSGEFSQGSPTEAVNFIVNKSDPAKDWYAHHRATQAAKACEKTVDPSELPRAITFSASPIQLCAGMQH